jgi:DNA-directed RNA polymerase subunit E'/Rpb7
MQKSKPIVQNIYSKCLLTRQITFNINDLSKSFDEIIKQNISFNYEGKCTVEGFIKKGSTRIINKSAGLIEKGINVVFEIVFECDICYMVEGTIIQCIVKNVTNAGITAEIENETPSPLVCFVARDHYYNDDYFSTINEGDKISIRVIGQRFELNDKNIQIIAELIKPKN